MKCEGKAEAGGEPLSIIGLRRMGFHEAFDLQVRLRDECIESSGRPGYLLLVEHPPVITIGRTGDRDAVLAQSDRLAELGVEVVETNRGGQVTYHGPGQLVAYPIISLRERQDLHRYLRDLEAWLVDVCRSCGVDAHADSPHTGVWVQDRKIASIGIAVRRWVTYHGVALNVSTDLSHFDLIVACGLEGVQMTSLERETDTTLQLQEVAERAASAFAEHFRMKYQRPQTQMNTDGHRYGKGNGSLTQIDADGR